MDESTINISLSLNKNDLICCICHESLTKKIYQCVNCNHYMCGTCDLKYQKNECPICSFKSRYVRNIHFEEQLKNHLKSCTNIGCNEKLFKWDNEHYCLFASVKCRVCKREVSGNIDSYCSHLESLCDETFITLPVKSFEKKLRYKPSSVSSVLKLPDNILIIIKKTGHSYKFSAVKNLDNEITNYKNIICTYLRNGIEHTVTIPITNLNESKIADIYFAEGEVAEFILSKDIQIKPKLNATPSFNTIPMQNMRQVNPHLFGEMFAEMLGRYGR